MIRILKLFPFGDVFNFRFDFFLICVNIINVLQLLIPSLCFSSNTIRLLLETICFTWFFNLVLAVYWTFFLWHLHSINKDFSFIIIFYCVSFIYLIVLVKINFDITMLESNTSLEFVSVKKNWLLIYRCLNIPMLLFFINRCLVLIG